MAREKTRITIKDLPKNKKISKDEMKKVFGGYYMVPPMPQAPEVPPTANWLSPDDIPPIYHLKPIWKK